VECRTYVIGGPAAEKRPFGSKIRKWFVQASVYFSCSFFLQAASGKTKNTLEDIFIL